MAQTLPPSPHRGRLSFPVRAREFMAQRLSPQFQWRSSEPDSVAMAHKPSLDFSGYWQ